MTYAPDRKCFDPEVLAAFAEGRLRGAQRASVMQHLDDCEECTRDVVLAMSALEEEDINVVEPRRWSPWLAAIAAAAVIAISIPAIRAFRGSPIDRLVDANPKGARIVEPRLAGGFAWAPYRGSPRATESPSSDPSRMKLTGVAGEVIERAQHDTSAQAQHEAGVAMVLTQSSEEAMARLEKAAAAMPSSSTWSDLAAARYATASDHGRPALYAQALAACDAALRIDASFPEALFNRALILERMGLIDAARTAWARYLEVDPSSKWANEARTHLSELPAAKQSSEFERVRPLIEDASARGDATALRGLLATHAARARAYAEAEYLGRWGEAVLQKKDADAARWLAVARGIGAEVVAAQGELLLRDATQVIDDVPVAKRDAIAEAHASYRAGRIAYSRKRLEEASVGLTRAARLFNESRSPMELAARYYMASIHQARHEPGAAEELQRVLRQVDAKPGYRALGAHVRWELGRAYVFDYDWPRAVATLSEAARMFHAAGDRTNEAFVEAILSYSLAAQGRGDEAWSWRIVSLRALSAEGNPSRLAAALAGAMRADFLADRNEAALALARLPQPVAGDAEQLSLVLDALQFESMLESQSGDAAGALRTARRASALAREIADPSQRARRLADIDVAIGAATAAGDPARAIAPLTRAIDFYRRIDLPMALPEPLLLRARCAARSGDADAAARDLEEGMSIVERHGDVTAGTGILDADRALFTDALRASLDRGDDAAAFLIAQRARGASITLAELQHRLAGSATAVLEIALLPADELVAFAISEDDVRVARRRVALARLAALAGASVTESGTTAAAALYDELLRPVDGILSRVQRVIVVPDPRMQAVPFAALYDTSRRSYLVERVTVATAPAAQFLSRNPARVAASVATVSLPAGDAAGTPALPQAAEELAEVASLYRHATAIGSDGATLAALRRALSAEDVVHVAGHTERQPAGGEYALLLRGPNSGLLERVSSRTVAASPLTGARLLVLAACETLRQPRSPDTHAQSLGSAFVAAGVANVIGTLTPIGDGDARRFFRELHRRLAEGESAGDALRATQISAIAGQRDFGGSQAWRSIALLTRSIDADERKVRS